MSPELDRKLVPRAAPHRRFIPWPTAETTRGLRPGEPEACRRDPREFLAILAHLGLLLAVFKVYRLEGRAFQLLATIAAAALPIHYVAHYRWKKPIFVAASIVALAWVFGAATAAVVLVVAAAFLGLCYLPVSWWARAACVASLGLACALARSGAAAVPVPEGVWPVLASMFMFRMMLYLYEIKHSTERQPLIDTIGYFFLLPNYCFLLFPVVDYRAFRRGYFAADVHALQREGLRLLTRGTGHLLLYRLVYHLLLVPADEVRGPASLARYVACNYLLYLRVSGQFHIAGGLLHLFGFALPETHRRYLLASSFTDYWRRINIYWKDFMVRLVFNPVAMRLMRRGQGLALGAATAAVFATTWLLHAYQSFWVRGTWNFSLHDGLFWGVLGLLVLVNVQLDARRPPRRDDGGWSAARVLKTLGTFATIALLWSLWSSPSVGAWLDLLRRGLAPGRSGP
ncbi:MAG TPA: hypothetical protein VG406_08530 [Isosphaeraceae bacterium]|jgi:D-alanyl-lipoteichoic acid acyltransferase DltB (MBOAT superfamily)|nr:hypothetical protein [Isosphaeraceae bacterium]